MRFFWDFHFTGKSHALESHFPNIHLWVEHCPLLTKPKLDHSKEFLLIFMDFIVFMA